MLPADLSGCVLVGTVVGGTDVGTDFPGTVDAGTVLGGTVVPVVPPVPVVLVVDPDVATLREVVPLEAAKLLAPP
jgi:hypothetical protein